MVWLRPWGGKPSEGQPAGEEYVWVQYTASFKLLSTNDNGPININLFFPYPHVPLRPVVDNEESIDTRIYTLYENFNAQILFAENRPLPPTIEPFAENYVGFAYVEQFETKFIVPTLDIVVRSLYPNDELRIEAWIATTQKNLTLVIFESENIPFVDLIYGPENVVAAGIFVEIKITKIVDGQPLVLEQWSRTIENEIPSAQPVTIRLFQ